MSDDAQWMEQHNDNNEEDALDTADALKRQSNLRMALEQLYPPPSSLSEEDPPIRATITMTDEEEEEEDSFSLSDIDDNDNVYEEYQDQPPPPHKFHLPLNHPNNNNNNNNNITDPMEPTNATTPHSNRYYKQSPVTVSSTTNHSSTPSLHGERKQVLTSSSSPSSSSLLLWKERVESLEGQLRQVMEEKHGLLHQLSCQRSQLQQLHVSKEEAKEELSLLKSLWEQAIMDCPTGHISTHTSHVVSNISSIQFPKLEELRGQLLHQVQQQLQTKSQQCQQLQSQLLFQSQQQQEQQQQQSTPTESSSQSKHQEEEYKQQLQTLKEEKQTLQSQLFQLQQQIQTIQTDKQTLQQQLQQEENDDDLLKEKVKALQKERDGLREEVNEWIQSRGGQPQKIVEKKYQLQLDTMRTVASQMKAEAQAEQQQASQEIQLWKTTLSSLTAHLQKLQQTGHIHHILSAHILIMASLPSHQSHRFTDILPNIHPIPDWQYASSTITRALQQPILPQKEEKKEKPILSSSYTQTDDDSNATILVTVGTNTDPMEEEPTPMINTIETNQQQQQQQQQQQEEKMNQMEMELANLQGSNSHLQEQIVWYQERFQEMKLKSESYTSPIKHSSSSSSLEVNSLQVVARLQQEMQVLQESRQVVEDENKQILQRCISLEQIAEDATKECETLSNQLSQLQQELNTLQTQQSKDMQTLAMDNQRKEQTYNQQLTSTMEDLQTLKNEYNALVQTKDGMEQELKLVREEKSQMETTFHNTQQKLEVEKQKIQEQWTNKFTESLEGLETEKSLAIEESRRLKQSMEELQTTIQSLQQKLQESQDNRNAEREHISNQKLKLTETISLLQSKCEAFESSNRMLSDREKELQTQCTSLRNQCSSNEEKVAMYESNLNSLKAQLSKTNQHNVTNNETIQRVQMENAEISKQLLEHEKKALLLENELANSRAKSLLLDKELSSTRIDLKTITAEKLAQEEQLSVLKDQLTHLSTAKDEVEKTWRGTTREHKLTMKKLETYQAKLNDANKRINLLTQKKDNMEGLLGTVRCELNSLSKTNSQLKLDFDKAIHEKKSLMEKVESFKSLVNELNARIETLSKEKSVLEKELNSIKKENTNIKQSTVTTDIDRFYQNDENSVVKDDINQLKNEIKLIKEECSALSARKKELEMDCERLETPFNNSTSSTPKIIKSSNGKPNSSHCYIVTDDGDLRVKTTVYGKSPNSVKSTTKNGDAFWQTTPELSNSQTKPSMESRFRLSDSKNTIGRPRRLELSCHKSVDSSGSKSTNSPIFSIPLNTHLSQNSSMKEQTISVQKKDHDSLDDKLNRLKLSAQRASMIANKFSSQNTVQNGSSIRSKLKPNKGTPNISFSPVEQKNQLNDIEETEAFIMGILSSCGK